MAIKYTLKLTGKQIDNILVALHEWSENCYSDAIENDDSLKTDMKNRVDYMINVGNSILKQLKNQPDILDKIKIEKNKKELKKHLSKVKKYFNS